MEHRNFDVVVVLFNAYISVNGSSCSGNPDRRLLRDRKWLTDDNVATYVDHAPSSVRGMQTMLLARVRCGVDESLKKVVLKRGDRPRECLLHLVCAHCILAMSAPADASRDHHPGPVLQIERRFAEALSCAAVNNLGIIVFNETKA